MSKKSAPVTTLSSPTARSYGSLDQAYDFFNRTLFDGSLPHCLITMARHKGAYGYFAPKRFADTAATDASETIDEIALNPVHFGDLGRDARATLSTLVHEMCHLKQAHFGTPSRNGYHNQEWSDFMMAVGLASVAIVKGARTDKRVGQSCSHDIVEGGSFDLAYQAFLAQGGAVLFRDRWEDEETKVKARKKNASKTKFTCQECGCNTWGKPTLVLYCGGDEDHPHDPALMAPEVQDDPQDEGDED